MKYEIHYASGPQMIIRTAVIEATDEVDAARKAREGRSYVNEYVLRVLPMVEPDMVAAAEADRDEYERGL